MNSILVPDGIRNSDTTEINMDGLVARYGNDILRMCFLYLKDKHLAEDATQETFIKVYKHYSQYNRKSTEKTWIMSIAINVCKNYLRKSWWKRIDESVALESIPLSDVGVQDDSLLKEVMKLDSKYREVILLYYYHSFKTREIASIIKKPEATVSVRLKRAREKLKSNLKGWDFDE